MEFNSLIKWVQPHFNGQQFYNGMISELEKKKHQICMEFRMK